MDVFHKICSLLGIAVFLFYGYAWLFVSEEYVMGMLVGIAVALHHYLHYKQVKQIYREKSINYMTMDAVRTAWGVEGVKRLATVAGQRFIDNAPDDIKRDCAEIVKESLDELKEFYGKEEEKSKRS